MLTQFLSSIDKGIEAYEALFTANDPMPLKRAQDIIDLRCRLKVGHFRDVSQAMNLVKQKIATFKTGWWLFRTGRSRLKRNLELVIHHYSQDLVRFMAGSIQDMQTLIREANFTIETPTEQELRQNLYTLRQENETLKQELTELKQEKRWLEIRVLELSDNASTNPSAEDTRFVPMSL